MTTQSIEIASAGAGSLHPVVRQKLWRVKIRGSGMGLYNPSHVISPDATTAYDTVRRELDRLDYGFSKDRELLSVELVAEDYEYTETGSRLFLPNIAGEATASEKLP